MWEQSISYCNTTTALWQCHKNKFQIILRQEDNVREKGMPQEHVPSKSRVRNANIYSNREEKVPLWHRQPKPYQTLELRGEGKDQKGFSRGQISGKRLEKLNIDLPQEECQKQQKYFKLSWPLLTAASCMVRENVVVGASRKQRSSHGSRLHQRSQAQGGNHIWFINEPIKTEISNFQTCGSPPS